MKLLTLLGVAAAIGFVLYNIGLPALGQFLERKRQLNKEKRAERNAFLVLLCVQHGATPMNSGTTSAAMLALLEIPSELRNLTVEAKRKLLHKALKLLSELGMVSYVKEEKNQQGEKLLFKVEKKGFMWMDHFCLWSNSRKFKRVPIYNFSETDCCKDLYNVIS